MIAHSIFQRINFWLRQDAVFYGILLAAMLIKYLPFGLGYYPYLDDYNAYGTYHYLLQAGESPLAIYLRYTLYDSRPLAGLLEVFFIAPLWNHLWVVLLFFTILHAATLPLLQYVCQYSGLPWGRAASLTFGLYPLLAEGAYWISASSRIMPGFFLLVLSAYGLCRYIAKDGRKRDLLTALISGFLSLWFYEQTVSLALAWYVIILWANRDRLIKKQRMLWLLPVAYLSIFGAYYYSFVRLGRQAARIALPENLLWQVAETFRKLGVFFIKEQKYNLSSLVNVEFRRFWAEPALFALPVLLGLVLSLVLAWALLLGFAADKPIPPQKKPGWRGRVFVVFGIAALLLSSYGPFFVLQGSFLTLRNIFFSVVAIAMAVQWLYQSLNGKWEAVRIPFHVIGAGMLWGAILLSMGSVSAFRVNYHADNAIAASMLKVLETENAAKAYHRVWLLGARYQYQPHGGVHLYSSTLNNWSLTSLINVRTMENGGKPYGLLENGTYFFNPAVANWHYADIIAPESDLLLRIDAHGQLRPLKMDGGAVYDRETGLLYGHIENTGQDETPGFRFIPNT